MLRGLIEGLALTIFRLAWSTPGKLTREGTATSYRRILNFVPTCVPGGIASRTRAEGSINDRLSSRVTIHPIGVNSITYFCPMDIHQFISGSVAGCVGQCVGHPLDSVKVVMQTSTSGSAATGKSEHVSREALSAYQSAVEMYRSPYGLRSFFRGLSLPLMTKSVEQCVAFGIKGAVGSFLEPNGSSSQQFISVADDSYRAGISGSIAGACTALLLTPVYLVKVQLQATTMSKMAATTTGSTMASQPTLAGPIEAIQATVARLGWRGLYTGALPTFLGSSIGYGFRFATYDKTVSWVNDEYNAGGGTGNPRTAKILSIILGGGLAGMATWLSHFPLDLVANKMMAEVVLSSQNSTTIQKNGMLAQFRTIYQQQGWRGYFRGLEPCLLRAFPVNAAIFLSYELCMGSF